MRFHEQDKPYLKEKQILRNDGENIIVYESSVGRHKFLVLPLILALILPLFDGTNSISDVKKYSLEILTGLSKEYTLRSSDDNKRKLCKVVDQTISAILNLDILTLEGAKSPSLKNIEKLVPNIGRYQFSVARLSRPLSVSISFTNCCQYDCIYCYAERKKCDEKKLSQWIKIFDELQENEIFLVDVGGTDIFTRSDALSILNAMVDRNFVFMLSTKCFIDKNTAKSLASMRIGVREIPEHLVRDVQLSIDSIKASVADYMVRKEDHYKKTIQSVKNLVKMGITPKIKCVLTPLNYLEMSELVKEFSSLGVRDFYFVQYKRSQYRHNDNLFLSRKHKEIICNSAEYLHQKYPHFNISIETDLSTGGHRNFSFESWMNRFICYGGRSNMIIQPNGDVTLCEHIPHIDKFVVGNVFDTGIMGVWNSKKVTDFLYPPRSKFKNSVCYECLEFEDCHKIKGYCYRNSLSSYGTIYDAQPECPYQTKMPIREI